MPILQFLKKDGFLLTLPLVNLPVEFTENQVKEMKKFAQNLIKFLKKICQK